jgi:hypothetical protein
MEEGCRQDREESYYRHHLRWQSPMRDFYYSRQVVSAAWCLQVLNVHDCTSHRYRCRLANTEETKALMTALIRHRNALNG